MNKKLLKMNKVESFQEEKHSKEDKYLERFENYLYNLINSLKFRKINKYFTETKRNKQFFFAFADKLLKIYKIQPELYKKTT